MKRVWKVLGKLSYPIWFVVIMLYVLFIFIPIWIIATHRERHNMIERDKDYLATHSIKDVSVPHHEVKK